MGDYVDRGYYSLETFIYLAVLKLKHADQVYLLRGNHECRQVNQMYGFYNQIQHNFGHAGIWDLCNKVFDLLPMAAVIDGKVFAVHGGLSKDIHLVENISIINRVDELPSKGPLCDLCWSDPDDEMEEWRENQRGAGWIFGKNPVKRFLQYNNLNLITRSHQMAMEGYQWFFAPNEVNDGPKEGMLVIVWSAPNYMYRSNNKASLMKIERGKEGTN